MSTYFVSDLHLDPATPGIARQFLAFLAGPARRAQSLYLLGDLFEAWLGDDDPEPGHQAVIGAIASLAGTGVAVHVMRGNRDFLLGTRFCRRAGALHLPDPVVLSLSGQRVLVTHGDALCTDDAAYQRLRALVGDPQIRQGLAGLPLDRRRAIAADARSGSRAHLARAGDYITDVNPGAVAEVMRNAGARVLIHGHTHRPGVHRFELEGRPCLRIVLGAWHDGGTLLHWDGGGFELLRYPG